ncbi:MAG: phosphomethylpyrimidine synthase ThiC, partial [Candidatus Brocadiia bacterium]
GLPSEEHVREGVIAARIAAQAADIAKGNKIAWEQNKLFSKLRRKCKWEEQISLSLDPIKSRRYRNMRKTNKSRTIAGCTMCGELCVYTLNNNI